MIRTNSSIQKNKVSANIAILFLLMRKDFNQNGCNGSNHAKQTVKIANPYLKSDHFIHLTLIIWRFLFFLPYNDLIPSKRLLSTIAHLHV